MSARWKHFLRDYAWWIGKNVLGWLLILLSPVLGISVPGPGGIPIFLIGFAMITLPGKRHLTARVFRGIPINLSGSAAGAASGIGACVLPLIAAIFLRIKLDTEQLQHLLSSFLTSGYTVAIVLAAMIASFLLIRIFLGLTNLAIGFMPPIRRKIRPWMRRMGIDLLPPRRRRRLRQSHPGAVDAEILEFHPRHSQRLSSFWTRYKPWILTGAAAVVIVVGVFFSTRT